MPVGCRRLRSCAALATMVGHRQSGILAQLLWGTWGSLKVTPESLMEVDGECTQSRTDQSIHWTIVNPSRSPKKSNEFIVPLNWCQCVSSGTTELINVSGPRCSPVSSVVDELPKLDFLGEQRWRVQICGGGQCTRTVGRFPTLPVTTVSSASLDWTLHMILPFKLSIPR